ncbi:MAG: hypothetical protein JXD18_11960 [Anaerolineae bacterium]|nr:hypothetical protein [Anaerolineae bacterium]
MKDRLRSYWKAFVNFAIIFSFIVNFVLVLVLLLAISPIFQAKTGILEPLLSNLDTAFLGLGETYIDTTVNVDQTIPIRFDLPLNQPLNLDFVLPIEQETAVVLTQNVQLNRPAQFILPGGGGSINGSVTLVLPAGLRLPVMLDMDVPVQTTIPVQMNVPVDQMVPIQMTIPVQIPLGEAGLDPAVQDLRNVFSPLRIMIEDLPDTPAQVLQGGQ